MLQSNKNAYFYIFSNDANFAKSSFIEHTGLTNYEVLDLHSQEQGHLDLYLMSKCKGAIIANSSFSLWGSYLMEESSMPKIAPLPFHTLSVNKDMLSSEYICIDYIWGNIVDENEFFINYKKEMIKSCEDCARTANMPELKVPLKKRLYSKIKMLFYKIAVRLGLDD